MYCPSYFSENRTESLHEFIQTYPLATIITSNSEGIVADLIPMSFHAVGEKGTLRCHFAKMNAQIERLKSGANFLLIFNGPQSYVSPSFYVTKKIHGKAVPTWNYTMVQVTGDVTVIDDPRWILQQITDLTEQQESGSPEPWKVTDAPEDYILGQLNALVGIEIKIKTIKGKFKVSQNQPSENQKSVEENFTKANNKEMANLVANKGLKK